jgi:hypothetical protein
MTLISDYNHIAPVLIRAVDMARSTRHPHSRRMLCDNYC